MKYLNLFLLLTLLVFSSCKENPKDKIAHLVAEWQGKEATGSKSKKRNYLGKALTRFCGKRVSISMFL